MSQELQKNKLLICVILIALTANVLCFAVAYPDITKTEFDNIARDFSAYYMGAYRLYHNPTQVFYDGSLPNDYPLVGTPQPYKYTPSFLIIMTPFLALNYMDALVIFNFIQLALMPLLAYFVYKLVKDKNYILASIAAAIVLVQPLPTPASNIPYTEPVHLGLFDINSQCFAPSYYCGYVYINAHILQAVLLVGALYFGSTKKPWLSALLFAFGLLDPRAALAAIPLILWYNRKSMRKFLLASTIVWITTLLPFFFYYDVGMAFLRMGMSANIISQSYAYDWIPIYAVLALSVVELISVVNGKFGNKLFRKHKQTADLP